MLILAVNIGHDGSVAVLRDRKLVYAIESEKDSSPRYTSLTPSAFFRAAERLDRFPDVVAIGGWHPRGPQAAGPSDAGYFGAHHIIRATKTLFGRSAEFFSSTHERSHVMMAAGMAPPSGHELEAVLVWEGALGAFYLLDQGARIKRVVPVLTEPGARYAFVYALADPRFPDEGAHPSIEDSGKLMALSAYADASDADTATAQTVDAILRLDTVHPAPKAAFTSSPLYNAGVEADCTKIAAALITDRIFERFWRRAESSLPAGIPLRISGGCGLNCGWNERWRQTDYFSSVFVPPCANDSGSAIGTAIDAQLAVDGTHHIAWSVYSGLEFECDVEPAPTKWSSRTLDCNGVAAALAGGAIVAWVQGRWEIGPRALGNRSLLGEPFHAATRERLNAIKKREQYRPIAPACRMEDVPRLFGTSFEDPYMLFSRRVRATHLGAVTHVDGTARLQTVTRASNPAFHELLSAFGRISGDGVLCNTSLNHQGLGFINRLSDLSTFCESQGIEHFVVGDRWFTRQP
jgi:hydroxymethyl cephem carbamoyltransferase